MRVMCMATAVYDVLDVCSAREASGRMGRASLDAVVVGGQLLCPP